MSGEWMINDKTVNGMKFRKYTLETPRQHRPRREPHGAMVSEFDFPRIPATKTASGWKNTWKSGSSENHLVNLAL